MTLLPTSLSDNVKDLCHQGYQAYDQGDFKSALRIFYQAWLLLPKPQTQHAESGWVLTAIGDTYFRLEQFPQAEEALRSALHCEKVDNNPFVLLRLGQALAHLDQASEAKKWLHQAYLLSAGAIFHDEPKHYLDLITNSGPTH